MARIVEPLAVFEHNGKEVEVFDSINVQEWLAAGFKPVEPRKKRGRKPATPEQKEQSKQNIVQQAVRSLVKDEDEL